MSITVNGIKWDIIYTRPNNPILINEDGVYTLGVTLGDTKQVFINATLSDYMLEKVLSHELCHVFCFSYNILLDRYTEELIADFLATYGRDVLDICDDLLCRFSKIC